MSEDGEQSRVEWLQSLSDDGFRRMQKVAQGPVYTRRQIAKYLGTGAVAALAGGASTGAVAADAGDAGMNGQVGTQSNPYDGFLRAVEYKDSSTDPSSNGNVQRNGNDIKAHSGGAVQNFSLISDHASRHHDGGDDELNAANLSSEGASDGEVVTAQGDGTNEYALPPTGEVVASETDDGSDVTEFNATLVDSPTTVVDITGSGILMSGWASTNEGDVSAGSAAFEITVDGGTQYTIPWRNHELNGASRNCFAMPPPIVFDSSLTVSLLPQNGNNSTAQLLVKQ